MTTGEFVKMKRPRGNRGKGSKRRSREKWLAKIGAAFAHHEGKRHCGMDATSCARSSAHRVTGTGGAAIEELGSGTPQEEAKRQVFAPGPDECALSALLGAADDAHQEKDAATKVAVMLGDAAVGQRGDSIPFTPTENENGVNGKGNDELATKLIVVVLAVVIWWANGWRVATAMSLAAATGLSLRLYSQIVYGSSRFLPVAAMKKGLAGKKKYRGSRLQQIKLRWARVFEVMVERGMAGELAQCQLANRKLQSQLTEAQEFVTKTLLYRQNKENDRIQSLEDTVGRLRAENEQLELALEHRVAECKEEARAKVAQELLELKEKAVALEHENARLVEQMRGLGQSTVDAEKALAEAELRFAGENQLLRRQKAEEVQELNKKLRAFQNQLRNLKWQVQLNRRPRSPDEGEAV